MHLSFSKYSDSLMSIGRYHQVDYIVDHLLHCWPHHLLVQVNHISSPNNGTYMKQECHVLLPVTFQLFMEDGDKIFNSQVAYKWLNEKRTNFLPCCIKCYHQLFHAVHVTRFCAPTCHLCFGLLGEFSWETNTLHDFYMREFPRKNMCDFYMRIPTSHGNSRTYLSLSTLFLCST